MPLTIEQLKILWEQEKNAFAIKELGGLQSFIRKVFECRDIFDLKERLESAKDENRKKEYIKEIAKKGKPGRADFVIFVKGNEIVIPVEVEKYQNIDRGEKQIFRYQLAWDKQYGILTDGATWRFYNNTVYREFSLDYILANIREFIAFWHDYIKPENYYLSFFEKKGEQYLFEKQEIVKVEKNRALFFDDITKLIHSFKSKLRLEGYFKDNGKTATEITYAYFIQFILYKVLVDNGYGSFRKEFSQRLKSIYAGLNAGVYSEILASISAISSFISKKLYRPFIKEQEFINGKLLEIFHKSKKHITDVAPWLDIFVFIKKYNFANIKNDIFGFIYENYLKELYEDKKKGQYFTDPAVVNFMLDEIGFKKSELKKRIEKADEQGEYISIMDPSCGSGTFLYSAVDRIMQTVKNDTEQTSKFLEKLINKNIFGLDIAEFPLYLAEMNILMRMLPLIVNEKYNNPIDKKIKLFKTRDSIAEFIGVDLEQVNGQKQFPFSEHLNLGYKSYIRDEKDLTEMKQSMRPPRRRFDYVIGNPPYVSYLECMKQKLLSFHFMSSEEKFTDMNNIFGLNLHSVPYRRKKYSPRPNLYSFFIALGLYLLKDKGKLCFIVPQTLLVNSDLDVIRYHLSKYTTIEKLITFSGKLFIGRGLTQKKPIPTSSLILVVSRKQPSPKHQVKIVNYERVINKTLDIGSYFKKTLRSVKEIPQKDLLSDITTWNYLVKPKKMLELKKQYQKNSENISIYYKHELAKNRFNSTFYFDGSINIPKKDILPDEISKPYYKIPNLKRQYYKASVLGYFPKDRKIKEAQGSQGLVVSQPKYKILWKYINFDGFYFSEGNSVLPMYQQYCITSNKKSEILYLFSLLNSTFTSFMLEAFLKVENEDKLTFLLGLTAVKNLIRIPIVKIGNEFIKKEIIKMTEKMLSLEDYVLSDFVDFSDVKMRYFDSIKIDGGSIILSKDNENISAKIIKNTGLVEKVIANKYYDNQLNFKDKEISFSDFKKLPMVDFNLQAKIKNYVDDLVFALYFKVPVSKIGINNAEHIKKLCQKNKFYDYIQSQ